MARSKVRVYLPGMPVASDEAVVKGYVDVRAVPPGGEVGQALVKITAADYDYAWANQSGTGGGSGPHGHPESEITNLVADLQALDARLDTLEAAPPPVVDHGNLTGLGDDDHPQYLTQARGDVRYPLGTDPRLSDARTPTAHAHPISDVTNLQSALDGKAASGAPAAAVSAHEGAPDPHGQYLTNGRGDARYAALSHNHAGVYDPAGTASSSMSAHTGATDPHGQYLNQARGDARYPLASALDEQIRDRVGATLVQGTNVTIQVDDANDTITINSTAGGAQTVNYFQPLSTETFTPAAGASYVATLANQNYGVQLVFLNGQQLQPGEYSATSTQVTVTPAEGALVATDRIAIVYARAAVFSGSYSSDIEITDSTRGVILRDRNTANRYRLFMANGVLGTELIT